MSNIGQAVGTVGGAAIGFALGGPMGALQGASVVMTVSSMIFPTKLPTVYGPRLDDLTVTLSGYGKPIPLLYGTVRAAGNIIWTTGLKETATTTKQGGKGGGGQKSVNYSYSASFAMAVSGRNITRIKKIWANKKVLFDVDAPSTPAPVTGTGTVYYDFPGHFDLRIYLGNHNEADSLIEADVGAANTPFYIGTAYIVFGNLELADYGNSIPNIEVEVEADSSILLSGVVRDIATRMGEDVKGDIWLDDVVAGYSVGTQTTVKDALIPLALAYDFDLIEEAHQISASRKPRMLSATLEWDDLAAHDPTGQPPDLLPVVRAVEKSFPRQINVSYFDVDFDYQTVTQVATRQQTLSELVRDVEVPVVLGNTQAREIALKVLWGEAAERVSATIYLGQTFKFLRAGMVIALPVETGHMPFRITNVVRGQNDTIELRVAYDDAAAYINTLEGAVPRATGNDLRASLPSYWMVFDAPLLQASNSETGIYWGVTSGDNWRGATLRRSVDGVNFENVSGVSVKSGIGIVATALPAGSTTLWDEVNTLTVDMVGTGIELDTVTALDVLNGANACWLGPESGAATGEIIQFREANLIAPGTYELSGLLRGRLGTEFAVGLHGADERLVLLGLGVFETDFGLGDWNLVRDYVAHSLFVDESLVTPRPFTNTGERSKPRSPSHVRGVRDTGNDLTVTWIPRTRIPVTGLAELVPLGEAVEAYEVDIIVSSVVVRTIAASTPEIIYTAAQQTADGITPGNPVQMRIYQLSATRGRGHAKNATV